MPMTDPLHVVRDIGRTGQVHQRPAAFEDFFEANFADLFGALCLVTRDRYEAEEIAQDAFLRMFERWDRLVAVEDLTGYLYRTAMNVFRKRLRRSAVAVRRAIGVAPVDDGIAAVEVRDAAVRAMAELTPRQRAVVVLTDLLGYSSDEAGKMLGIRASTIRVHASRAHAALRTTMKEQR